MSSLRPSRYKLLTFFVAVIVGIVVADWILPEARSWQNALLSAGIAAAVAVLLAWIGQRRGS